MAQILLVAATSLQLVAVLYCVLLLRRHRVAAPAWLCLLGALLSMLVWRIVMSTGATPGPAFNTSIAIWGSLCAVLAMFFFGREVARRERAEAERDRLLQSERAARSEAERANRIKDEFLATLSHELRTPLTAILGWCSILRNGEAAPDAGRAVATIERNARVQARLVDDLLDATRMQAGTLHLDMKPLSLDGPVAAAIEGVRPAADAKRIAIAYDCADPAPVVVGDANRLQQIAANLLVNAVKFTPDGKRITVSLAAADGHADLSVTDEGIGIDASFLPQLFQRFSQADGSNSRRHGGLGLGLSIASSLADLHQGSVMAMSNGAGQGATFRLRLPLTAAAPAPVHGTAAATMDGDTTGKVLDEVRVLVVDDETDVRAAVTGLLERSGARVLALESGVAIDAAMSSFRPDVLLLDISMPGEDGYTLIRRVRCLSAAEGGTVPAVSLTAHARDEDREHALASGFQAHLPKPVHLPALVSTIRHLVGDRLAPRATAPALALGEPPASAA
ncbi:MAG: ATP-binding protein [Vicinamibacterales bacterium]